MLFSAIAAGETGVPSPDRSCMISRRLEIRARVGENLCPMRRKAAEGVAATVPACARALPADSISTGAGPGCGQHLTPSRADAMVCFRDGAHLRQRRDREW